MSNIVVIGSSNTDMVVKSSHIPKPGETVTGGSFLLASGGKGANQAVAAARLGAHVTFVSCVGGDMFGRQALEQYEKEGIDISRIETIPESASGIALIMVDQKGENLISVASGANSQLKPSHIDHARGAIESADLVVIQLEIPLETVEYAVCLAARAGVPVLLDPAPVPDVPLADSLLSNLFCIKPNESEARRLTGQEVFDIATAQRAADALIAQGAKHAIITLGAHGSLAVSKTGRGKFIPAMNVAAVDSTAAGDAFSGALAFALASGHDFEAAARFASTAAAISVTRLGAQPSLPVLNEVKQAMASH